MSLQNIYMDLLLDIYEEETPKQKNNIKDFYE
jgi:hypothetical protein